MELKCLKCGHKWNSRVDNPVECPKCMSRSWKDYKRKTDMVIIANAILEQQEKGQLCHDTIDKLKTIIN